MLKKSRCDLGVAIAVYEDVVSRYSGVTTSAVCSVVNHALLLMAQAEGQLGRGHRVLLLAEQLDERLRAKDNGTAPRVERADVA